MSIGVRLRFDIFKRDNFTCTYCRRSSWGDGVKLHIDHVIPRSRGGSDRPSNLTTACADCNLGKSNSLVANPVRMPRMDSTIRSGSGWHHIGQVLDEMYPELAGA